VGDTLLLLRLLLQVSSEMHTAAWGLARLAPSPPGHRFAKRTPLLLQAPPCSPGAGSPAGFLSANADEFRCLAALLDRSGLRGALAVEALTNTYFLPSDAAFISDLAVSWRHPLSLFPHIKAAAAAPAVNRPPPCWHRCSCCKCC
jgi:hypothetical protein